MVFRWLSRVFTLRYGDSASWVTCSAKGSIRSFRVSGTCKYSVLLYGVAFSSVVSLNV